MIEAACPGTQELDDLLNEQTDADHEARLVAHIQTCKSCQEQLYRLTAGCNYALNDWTFLQSSRKDGQVTCSFSMPDPDGTTDFGPAAFVPVTDQAGDPCPQGGVDRNPVSPSPAEDRAVARNGSPSVEAKRRPEGGRDTTLAQPEVPG